MNIPETLRAGDTISWTETISDYPATDGWTLAFVLVRYGQSPITITASASGADYAISILPAVTRLWIAGLYSWQAYVYKSSGIPPVITEKKTIEPGRVTILPDLTQVTSMTDLRSFAQKNYEAITEALSKDPNAHIVSYSIGGRSISKSREAALVERSLWKTEYDREVIAENHAKGLDINPNRIGVRFQKI